MALLRHGLDSGTQGRVLGGPSRARGVHFTWHGPPICTVVGPHRTPQDALPGSPVSHKIGHQIQVQLPPTPRIIPPVPSAVPHPPYLNKEKNRPPLPAFQWTNPQANASSVCER